MLITTKAELRTRLGLAHKPQAFRRLLREFESRRGFTTTKAKIISVKYAEAFIDWLENLHKA